MKKFSSFFGFDHMRDDFCHLNFVFFFAILFIEDAVGFVAEPDTSEEIITSKATINIAAFSAIVRNMSKF